MKKLHQILLLTLIKNKEKQITAKKKEVKNKGKKLASDQIEYKPVFG